MHVRNGSHKSMHNYNKILEEISDGLEVEKVFLGKAKSIIATIYYTTIQRTGTAGFVILILSLISRRNRLKCTKIC